MKLSWFVAAIILASTNALDLQDKEQELYNFAQIETEQNIASGANPLAEAKESINEVKRMV